MNQLRRARIIAAAGSLLVLGPGGSLLSDAARAQSGFFSLFGLGRPAAPPVETSRPHAYADPSGDSWRDVRRGDGPAIGSGPSVAYCVRTCDGRHFPIPKNAGGSSAQICSAMCPSAKTEVFHGSAIDHAVSTRGQRYANLENAFVYRERIVDGCTCNGKDSVGLTRIDFRTDPTLQAGDIVVTEAGPMAFKGGKKAPFQAADFTPAQSYAALPKTLRGTVAEMRVQKKHRADAAIQEAPPSMLPARARPIRRAASPPPED